ncbi:hypothetical protein [Streptomyces sp. SID9727]|uniref:hypothetical protein n=1 Tax=Streptomyces sp. SID9727 TaxID=2706114 RepID=UPI0013CA5D60|nr:hypothetical protein [Streptomyces sp. SID9727]NEC69213.1 hypothetical protein [Streptomyces sp. SID9727]
MPEVVSFEGPDGAPPQAEASDEAPAPDASRVAPARSCPSAPRPLPPTLLALLGDVADAEGADGEAAFWYGLAGRTGEGRTTAQAHGS